MKEQPRNDWKRHNGIDSIFNGGVIGLAIAGLLVAVILGPDLESPTKATNHGAPVTLGVRA